jgi:molybdate/tungstate transport system ATP-binding protein
MIEIRDLTLDLGRFALTNISLKADQEYLVILGRTGSGKTTLLECIAGLRRIDRGEIFIEGRNVTDLPPEKRNIAYLPQDIALFPHLNVKENIAFGLKFKGISREEIEKEVLDISEMFGISNLLSRRITHLSGGERQRVALARALILKPKLLLLDEPFSSLDLDTKRQLWLEIKELKHLLRLDVLHVTHDIIEAISVGEAFALMQDGLLRTVTRSEIEAPIRELLRQKELCFAV